MGLPGVRRKSRNGGFCSGSAGRSQQIGSTLASEYFETILVGTIKMLNRDYLASGLKRQL